MVKICSAIVKISSELVKISSDLVWISSELVWRISELLKTSVFRNAAMSVFGMPMSFCHRQISRILIFYFVRVFVKIATSSTGEELCSTFGLLLNLITSCSVSVGSWVSCNKIPLFPGWQLVATNDQINRTYLASKILSRARDMNRCVFRQCCPKRFSIKTKKGSKEGVNFDTPSKSTTSFTSYGKYNTFRTSNR